MQEILILPITYTIQQQFFLKTNRDFYSRLYLHFIFPKHYDFRNKIFHALNIDAIQTPSFGLHMTLWQGIYPLEEIDTVCEKLANVIPGKIQIQIEDIFESRKSNIIATIISEQVQRLQQIALEISSGNGNYPFLHCTLARNISSFDFTLDRNTFSSIQEIFRNVESTELIYRHTN